MGRVIKIVVALVGFFCMVQVTAKENIRSAEYRISNAYYNASNTNLIDYNLIIQNSGNHQFKYALPEDDNDDGQFANEKEDEDSEVKAVSFNRAERFISFFHELAAPFFLIKQPLLAYSNPNNSIYNSNLSLYLQLGIIKI